MKPMTRLACLCLLLAPLSAGAELELPRWEIGAGVAGFSHPDYRGASHVNYRAFPAPYLVYRGDRLQVKRDGLQLRLFGVERLRLGISAAASLPGDDEAQDSPRAGMPALDPTFEIGPSLDIGLGPEASPWAWRFRVPVRVVVATDFSRFDRTGWVANPHLNTRRDWRRGDWSWQLSTNLGALWATREHHAYFYEVDPAFATPDRPAYRARSGYSGARLSGSLSARRERLRIGIGVVHDRLDGAVFEDSPVVQTDAATLVGAWLTWELWRSRETVRVGDEDR